MPETRNILDVIQQIKEACPDKERLLDQLEALKQLQRYTAPEDQDWDTLCRLLGSALDPDSEESRRVRTIMANGDSECIAIQEKAFQALKKEE